MKLKEYIANLQEICNKYPNLKVIYSSDEEGNNFDEVCYSPTIGKFKNGEFENMEGEKTKPNAVVIN